MDPVPVADQQILVGTPAVLSVIWKDQSGEPVAATGAVHVVVVDANGSTVVASSVATAGDDTGSYTYPFPAATNTQLAFLTATWTDTTGAARTTRIEVVGGFWFTTAEAMLAEPSIKISDPIFATRREVEDEAEKIIGWAFVPRYARVTLDGQGDGELIVPNLYLRTVRSVKVTASNGTPYTFTTPELNELLFPTDAVILRPAGKGFNQGRANVTIEYEHGWDRPPQDLQRAAITRLRYRLNAKNTGILDRATSYTDPNGQTVRIAAAEPNLTGMPDVDAVYQRIASAFDGGSGPASRPYDLDPTQDSVFHGLRR